MYIKNFIIQNNTESTLLKNGAKTVCGKQLLDSRFLHFFIDIAKRLGNKSSSFLSIIVAHAIKYRAPANLNYFYSFGFLLAIAFLTSISFTGVSGNTDSDS